MNGSDLLNMQQKLDFFINPCGGSLPTKNEVPIFCWIMGLLFYSIPVIKADVTLESVKTGEVRNMDNVPLFIASTG